MEPNGGATAAAAAGGAATLGFTEIETCAETLGRSVIFYIVKEIIGFVLYMHHQIPSILQNLEREFDGWREEYKDLEETVLSPNEGPKASLSLLRRHNLRKRELKQGIKRLEKLMSGISSLLSALQDALDQVPEVLGVTLALGGSPLMPQNVYEVLFSHGGFDSGSAKDGGKSKVAETLSRKAIRALISNGAGCASYSGPAKLYLMIRCSSSLNLPLHFLPKREFRYNKKVVPFKLHVSCKTSHQEMCFPDNAKENVLLDANQNDVIWFQCRHTVKGIACRVSPEDC